MRSVAADPRPTLPDGDCVTDVPSGAAARGQRRVRFLNLRDATTVSCNCLIARLLQSHSHSLYYVQLTETHVGALHHVGVIYCHTYVGPRRRKRESV